jgi:hypothetical protein
MAAATLTLLTACAAQVPRDSLQLPAEAAALRELQTRRFDGLAEGRILAASAAVLQDLGFTIDEVETSLGLIVGSKERSAVNDAQVMTAYLLTAISILALSPTAAVYAKRQEIRGSLATTPARAGKSGGQTAVRVTFQRVVYDNYDHVMRVEQIEAEDLYQEFFDRLSQSVFLEVQSP